MNIDPSMSVPFSCEKENEPAMETFRDHVTLFAVTPKPKGDGDSLEAWNPPLRAWPYSSA